jgi:hypothetical protein
MLSENDCREKPISFFLNKQIQCLREGFSPCAIDRFPCPLRPSTASSGNNPHALVLTRSILLALVKARGSVEARHRAGGAREIAAGETSQRIGWRIRRGSEALKESKLGARAGADIQEPGGSSKTPAIPVPQNRHLEPSSSTASAWNPRRRMTARPQPGQWVSSDSPKTLPM